MISSFRARGSSGKFLMLRSLNTSVWFLWLRITIYKFVLHNMKQRIICLTLLFLLICPSQCWPNFKVEASVGLEQASRTLADALDKSLGDHIPHAIRVLFLEFKQLLDGLTEGQQFTKEMVNSLKNTGLWHQKTF